MKNFTHKETVDIVARWLKRHQQNLLIPNCPLIAKEIKSASKVGEIPDIIGWCSHASILIEVKISVKDFTQGLHKPFRVDSRLGMGDQRYYACPANMITPIQIPSTWGLLYVHSDRSVEIVRKSQQHEANLESERALLYSLHRRRLNEPTDK